MPPDAETPDLSPEAASRFVAEHGQFAVGVNNSTDFLHPATKTPVVVEAEAWLAIFSSTPTQKVLARGQLRLQNLPLPTTDRSDAAQPVAAEAGADQ